MSYDMVIEDLKARIRSDGEYLDNLVNTLGDILLCNPGESVFDSARRVVSELKSLRKTIDEQAQRIAKMERALLGAKTVVNAVANSRYVHRQFAGEIAALVDSALQTTDSGHVASGVDFESLDPGIRETVRLLRLWGFETCDSGDGHTKIGDMECAIPESHVWAHVRPSALYPEALRLWAQLLSEGFVVAQNGLRNAGELEIRASYDPVTGSALIGLFGLNDEMLTARRKETKES